MICMNSFLGRGSAARTGSVQLDVSPQTTHKYPFPVGIVNGTYASGLGGSR